MMHESRHDCRRLAPRSAQEKAKTVVSFASRTSLLMQHGLRAFSGRGSLPNFLLLGAQKAGTTSLFNYICRSPQVIPPLRKEVHYFDQHELPRISWYQAFFTDNRDLARARAITGEATPFYLFHPEVPQRIAQSGLRPKLVIILRCPVERAWSHYRHEVRKGREGLNFADALAAEADRLRATTDRVLDRPHLEALKRQSYLSRGRYMSQIVRFQRMFGAEWLFTLSLDQLRSDPADSVSRCCAFLGIEPPPRGLAFPVLNVGGGNSEMPYVNPAIFREAFDAELEELTPVLPEAETWRERLYPRVST